MPRKLYSILMCCRSANEHNRSSQKSTRNKNDFCAHRAFLPFACHIVIVDMSFPLGNFSIPCPCPRIRNEKCLQKMSNGCWAGLEWGMDRPDPPADRPNTVRNTWKMDYEFFVGACLFVRLKAKGRAVYAVSHGHDDDVIKFSRFSLLSSDDNVPRHTPRSNANATRSSPHSRHTNTHTHARTHRAVR